MWGRSLRARSAAGFGDATRSLLRLSLAGATVAVAACCPCKIDVAEVTPPANARPPFVPLQATSRHALTGRVALSRLYRTVDFRLVIAAATFSPYHTYLFRLDQTENWPGISFDNGVVPALEPGTDSLVWGTRTLLTLKDT